MFLSADIGGTKTALGLSTTDNPLKFVRSRVYQNSDYSSFEEILDDFSPKTKFTKLILAVAGPVNSGKVELTNINWKFNQVELKERYGCSVVIVNDLEAAAYGIQYLTENQILTLQESTNDRGNEILVSIGTGIGKAQIFHNENMIYPSEAGHIGFAARTKFQKDFSTFIHENYGFPSYEMVVSSTGFHYLRKFLISAIYFDISEEFNQKLRMSKEIPKLIYETSLLSNDDAKICQVILDEFSSIVGVFLSDLALIHLPSRILLTGGIGRNILNHKQMLNAFINRGEMREILAATGLSIIIDPDFGLKGAAIYASVTTS